MFICLFQPAPSGRYSTGTLVALHCALGEVPTGAISALCLNGKWTAKLGTCKSLSGNTAAAVASGPKSVLVTDSGITGHSLGMTGPLNGESTGTEAEMTVTVPGQPLRSGTAESSIPSISAALIVPGDMAHTRASVMSLPTVSVLASVTGSTASEPISLEKETGKSALEQSATAASSDYSEAMNAISAAAASAESAASIATVAAEDAAAKITAVSEAASNQLEEASKAAGNAVSGASEALAREVLEASKAADVEVAAATEAFASAASAVTEAAAIASEAASRATEAAEAVSVSLAKAGISEGADVVLGALEAAGANARSKSLETKSKDSNVIDRAPALQVTATSQASSMPGLRQR